MAPLLHKNDHAGLRKFAAMMMVAFPLFFSLLVPWLFSFPLQWWPLLVSLCFAALYGPAPGLIYYPYRAWMAVAAVVAWINTRLILGFTYYVLILPIGLVLRLLGKLQYSESISRQGSYYRDSDSSPDPRRLEQPF